MSVEINFRIGLCVCTYMSKIFKNKMCVEIKSGMSIISDKMDGALLGVRNINHKYIVVEMRKYAKK